MPLKDRQAGLIDFVMPALNEGKSIAHTIEALFDAVAGLPYRFELIVVDDGSTDDTAGIVEHFESRLPIRLVCLTRNFGKETALLAGLDLARGDATIIMDADLQHPVAVVSEFLKYWREGYDCVYAVRKDRDDEPVLKRLFARLFYYGVNRGASVRIPRNALDFRLLDRSAVKALCSMRERVRFTKGLYAWLGVRSRPVSVAPAPRLGGESRFDFNSLRRLGWDGLTYLYEWPLRLAGSVGLLVASGSIAYGVYEVVRTLIFGVDVPGWATITVAVCLVGGLQLLFLGVLGQYVRSIFIESKQRPNYLVKDFSQSELCARQRVGQAMRGMIEATEVSAPIREKSRVTATIDAA
jgi:glycosyltransferase involved in cell wall biosynthesis